MSSKLCTYGGVYSLVLVFSSYTIHTPLAADLVTMGITGIFEETFMKAI